MKFMRNKEAVSPVIAVILMVAITVVLAATVYVWVSGFGGQGDQTPSISFSKDDSNNKLTIVSCDPNILWSNIGITCAAAGEAYVDSNTDTYINAGEYIQYINGSVSITLTYTPTNTLLGTWEFTA